MSMVARPEAAPASGRYPRHRRRRRHHHHRRGILAGDCAAGAAPCSTPAGPHHLHTSGARCHGSRGSRHAGAGRVAEGRSLPQGSASSQKCLPPPSTVRVSTYGITATPSTAPPAPLILERWRDVDTTDKGDRRADALDEQMERLMARCALVRGRYSGSPPSFCGAGVMKVRRALGGIPSVLLCFRHYGTTQVTAQVLDANPGLCRGGNSGSRTGGGDAGAGKKQQREKVKLYGDGIFFSARQ